MKKMGQREVLKNLVIFFTYEVPKLTPTKLIKLIYLADVEHYKKHRCSISEVPFFSHHYGPWHPIIESIVFRECQDLIEVESIQTRKGDVIRIHKPKTEQVKLDFPSEEIIDTLKTVVEEWGSVSADKIVKFIKSTSPFIETGKGQLIDFMLADSEFRESIEKASKQAKEGKLTMKALNEL